MYEIDTVFPSNNQLQIDTIYVEREFRYNGIVQPPAEQIYKENINGTIYGGTLRLHTIMYEDDFTYATYTGTLAAIN